MGFVVIELKHCNKSQILYEYISNREAYVFDVVTLNTRLLPLMRFFCNTNVHAQEVSALETGIGQLQYHLT